MSRYVDEFLSLNCLPDLLSLGVKYTSKEISESMAAKHAVRDKLKLSFHSPDIFCVCVGDGVYPRTGLLMSFLTKWKVVSVDPALKSTYFPVANFMAIRDKVEDVQLQHDGIAVILMVHSHASLTRTCESIYAPQKFLVNIPCCVEPDMDVEPDIEYTDKYILSSKNTVQLWGLKNVKPLRVL